MQVIKSEAEPVEIDLEFMRAIVAVKDVESEEVLEVCDIGRFKSGAGKDVVVDDKKIDYVRRSEQERTFI